MTEAERELLKFLAMDRRSELDEWSQQPSRSELRQRLDEILRRLREEEFSKDEAPR